ncbi:MAG: hypothetical protein JSW11_00350 [Candidatus Heimdallarchaeota archaeon]|nr:MAG: hypothetical protein JSW11_00350 [Candidatus Heimdallarchaeota archaeon]
MSESQIRSLLKDWSDLLENGEKKAKTKASELKGSLLGRTKRTTGSPIIYEHKIYSQQSNIQKRLCEVLPKWTDLIMCQPTILMDGHSWPRGDYIELYFSHYKLIVEKLQKILNQKS